MFHRWRNIWVVALFTLGSLTLRADLTNTGSTGGNQGSGSGTGTVVVTSNVLNPNGTRTVAFTWALSKTYGNNEVGVAVRYFNTSDVMTSTTNVGVVNGLEADEDGGTYEFTTPTLEDGYATIRVYRTSSINDGVVTYSTPAIEYFYPTAPLSYKVTLTLPPNTGRMPQRYAAIQDGEQIAQKTQLAGDPATEWVITTSDPSNVIVQLVRAQVHMLKVPDSEPPEYVMVETGNEFVSTVGSYTPTQSTSGTKATAPTPPPDAVSPVEIKAPPTPPTPPSPTAAPTAPTPAPAPAAPVYKDLPWTTPSGTTEAKTQDIQELGNAIVDSQNKQTETASNNAAAIVTAVNAASTGIVAALGNVVTAQNTQTSSSAAESTSILQELGNIRAVLEAQVSGGGGGGGTGAGGPAWVDSDTLAKQEAAKAQASGASAKAEAEGSLAGFAVAPPGEFGEGSEPSFEVDMPDLFGGMTIDFNPFRSDRMGPLAAWLRMAMGWVTLVTLAGWLATQLKADVQAMYTAPQAKGNTIAAGTGGQATAAAAAGLITAAVITATVALMSWAYGDISFASLTTVLGTNPVSTLASGVVWCIDQVLPIATVLSALLARVAYPLYAMYVYAGVATVIRWVVP